MFGKKKLWLLATVATLALALSACGGGGDGPITNGDGMLPGDGDGGGEPTDETPDETRDGNFTPSQQGWRTITSPTLGDAGIAHDEYDLRAWYDDNLSPHISSSSPARQPTIAGTWTGEWSGYIEDEPYSGEARVDVTLDQNSAEAVVSYDDIPELGNLQSGSMPISAGAFRGTTYVAGVGNYQVRGQFGGPHQIGVVGYANGPDFLSAYYGERSLSTPVRSPFLEDAADADALLNASIRLSESKANFASGSVTRSTNRDTAGVTTDRADATWDGTKLTVNVLRADGSHLTIEEDLSKGQSRLVEIREPDSHTLAVLMIDWNDGDPTDYQAGGAWIHATGDPASSGYTSVEVGAFADSSVTGNSANSSYASSGVGALSNGAGTPLSQPIQLPVSGRAWYNGFASGTYGIEYGLGFEDIPAGSSEAGTFTSNVELQAYFGGTASSVSGCFNCDGLGRVRGTYYETGDYKEKVDTSAPIAMAFYGSKINEAGEFGTNLVAIDDAGERPANFSVSSSLVRGFRVNGRWDGLVSRKVNADGVPISMSGIVAGVGRHPLGTVVTFNGSFGSWLGNYGVSRGSE